MLSKNSKPAMRGAVMQRKIHMQDQVKNRVAEIMDDRRSDWVIAWGMKVLVISAIMLVGVVW